MKSTLNRSNLAKFITKEVFWRQEEHFFPPESLWSREIFLDDIKKLLNYKIKKKDDINLYVHIPFCASRCSFCNCFTFAQVNEGVHDSYLKALEKEIRMLDFPKGYKIKTLYLGGGTPSVFSDTNFRMMFVMLSKYFNIASCKQITVEMSPYTVTKAKAKVLREFGVNRVTLGVQTFDDDLLIKLNRPQSKKDVLRACKYLNKEGIHCINFDLMAGLPYQTVDLFKNSIRKAAELNPAMVTIYSFTPTLSSNALFSDRSFDALKIRQREEMFSFAEEFFSGGKKNLKNTKNEMKSNIQLMEYQKHNSSILGLGYGAISHISSSDNCAKGLRYRKDFSINDYMKGLNNGFFPKLSGYRTNTEDEMRTLVISNLQTTGRISLKLFRTLFRKDLEKVFKKEVEFLMRINKLNLDVEYITAKSNDEVDKFICAKIFYGQKYLRELENIMNRKKSNAEAADFKQLFLENREREFRLQEE